MEKESWSVMVVDDHYWWGTLEIWDEVVVKLVTFNDSISFIVREVGDRIVCQRLG